MSNFTVITTQGTEIEIEASGVWAEESGVVTLRDDEGTVAIFNLREITGVLRKTEVPAAV